MNICPQFSSALLKTESHPFYLPWCFAKVGVDKLMAWSSPLMDTVIGLHTLKPTKRTGIMPWTEISSEVAELATLLWKLVWLAYDRGAD